MATTAIWKINGRIDKVLNYVENPGKTVCSTDTEGTATYSKDEVMALRDVMDYAVDGGKTERQQFVSGVNCDAATARRQMIITKKQWQKEDGIVAFHGYQSFAPGETTPELAHRIGVELAEKLWGDRFEVIVATHLNTNCYHNHFLLNSVSFVDGKRFYDNKKTYRRMREVSDELCREYDLSVVKNPKRNRTRYTEWQAQRSGEATWKTPIRNDIDAAIAEASNFPAFVRALKAKGYTLRFGDNIKYMSVQPPWYNRSVRIYRLGENYTEDAIRCRLSDQQLATTNAPPRKTTKRVLVAKGFKMTRLSWKGLRAQYYYYIARMKKAQRRPQTASFVLRSDLRYMQKISEQAAFLAKHGLESAEQINMFSQNVGKRIERLQAARQQLRNETRRIGNAGRREDFQYRIAALSKELKPLYRQRKMCEEILLRAEKIKESMDRLRQEQKEVDRKREPRTRRCRTDR